VGEGDNAPSAAIGRDGQVYFDDLAPGVHVLQATSDGSAFTCELTVPSGEPMAWLGEIACVPR
jgi:outer membrane usher protein FimD/PapC